MQVSHTAPASIAIPKDFGAVVQAVSAMILGLFIVGVVGFSNIDVVHNAAHDIRHSNGFPCH
jgi:cobalt transporter subunit CbtB